jgi:hypothetical protein
MIEPLQAPIPGQSLTTPPGSFPFERPPEISDPEEAIQMHLTRLSDPEMMEDMLDMLELEVPISQLTEGILRSAVAEGIHSIDISLAIAPVLHEFMKLNADESGIEYEEGLEDKEEKAARHATIKKAKATKLARKFLEGKPKEDKAAPIEEPPKEMTADKGFMQRRSK